MKVFNMRLSIAIVIIAFGFKMQAQTNLSGNVNSNITLDLSGSPYTITGVYNILSGKTLTIDPGVEIKNPGNFDINILGALVVNGSTTGSVKITGGNWSFRKTDLSLSRFSYCNLNSLYVKCGVGDPVLNSNTLKFDNVVFESCFIQNTNNWANLQTIQVSVVNSVFNNSKISMYDDNFTVTFDQCSGKNGQFYFYGFMASVNKKLNINSCKFLNADLTNSSPSKGYISITKSILLNSKFVTGLTMNATYTTAENSIFTLTNVNRGGSKDDPHFIFKNCIVKYIPNEPDFKWNGMGSAEFHNSTLISNTICSSNVQLLCDIKTFDNSTLVGYVNGIKGAFNSITNSNFLYNSFNILNNAVGTNVNAQGNYWGVNTSNEIDKLIFDQNDDINLGLIDYSNFKTTPLTACPISPPQGLKKEVNTGGGFKISWNPNPESDLKGYKIYYGSADGVNFNNVIDVGNVNSYILPNIQSADIVSVTAYDASADGVDDMVEGNESWYGELKQEKALIAGNAISAFCTGQPLTLNGLAAPAAHYQWFNNKNLVGTDDASILIDGTNNTNAGNYKYIVTYFNGCSDTSNTIDVRTYSFVVIPSTVHVTCNGSVKLPLQGSLNNTSVAPYFNYTWKPATYLDNANSSNPLFTAGTNTTYTVEIGFGACSNKSTVNTIVDAITANNKTVTTTCAKSIGLGNISTDYTGSNPLSYSWTPATGLSQTNVANPSATLTSSQTYTVNIDNNNGCTAQALVNVTVNPIIADAGMDVKLTCGDSIQLSPVKCDYMGTGKLSYNWSPSIGLNSATVINPKISLVSSQTYTVNVSSSEGCSGDDIITVNVNPLIINAGSDATIACGDKVQLNVTSNGGSAGSLSYAWLPVAGLNNPAVSNPEADGKSSQTYTVTVKNNNLCETSDEVKIILAPQSSPEICIVTVDPSGKNMLVWEKGSKAKVDSFLIYKETGVTNVYSKIGAVSVNSISEFIDQNSNPEIQANKYKISKLDSCGLESPQSAFHKTMHLSINKGIGNAWNLIWDDYLGFQVTSYNIYRVTATNNLQLLATVASGNNQYSDLNPPNGTVFYQVEVVGPKACNPTRGISSSFSNKASSLTDGIQNAAVTALSFTLYPNPAKDVLTINFDGGGSKFLVEIFNSTGQLVLTKQMNQTKNDLDVSELSSGVYMVKVNSTLGNVVKKLIKE